MVAYEDSTKKKRDLIYRIDRASQTNTDVYKKHTRPTKQVLPLAKLLTSDDMLWSSRKSWAVAKL